MWACRMGHHNVAELLLDRGANVGQTKHGGWTALMLACLNGHRDVTELLLAITPSAISELRDRGLLAYHLNDFTGALRDLETYLKLASMGEIDEEEREEHQQIWEHVKTLRRRVASLN